MKKLLIVTLVLLLVLAGCSTGTTKTGLGSDITTSFADATADAEGEIQFNCAVAAVTLDADGKILGVEIDNAQVAAAFSTEGVVTTEAGEFLTKVEKGDDYGMKANSAIGYEWYEQINALEDWMVGKTLEEVLAMKTYDKGDGFHTTVPDEADLLTSCTIDVAQYLAAVEQACTEAK